MKLLLDQNVSHRLVAPLSEDFPETTQVALLGMGEADDLAIWELAKRQGYAIVTHDADFEAYSLLTDGPPLVIWLRCGNQPKEIILEKLRSHQNVIKQAHEDAVVWCIEIY